MMRCVVNMRSGISTRSRELRATVEQRGRDGADQLVICPYMYGADDIAAARGDARRPASA